MWALAPAPHAQLGAVLHLDGRLTGWDHGIQASFVAKPTSVYPSGGEVMSGNRLYGSIISASNRSFHLNER